MSPIPTGPSRMGVHLLAIPAAVTIIVFLGYSSQWLFATATALDPGPLSAFESVLFNALLACLWWTYFRACSVDPGRYVFDEQPESTSATAAAASDGAPSTRRGSFSSSGSSSHAPTAATAVRWCKKCNAPKPARSHHCRHCRRCIPKMDHHCPWTGNCVSMQTFPHFLRFVVFTNLSLWFLAALLSRRFYALYAQRYLPAYLGPTLSQLVHLTILGLVCGATLLALSIMLYTTVNAWLFNTTMIEGWEIDRHEAVIDRYNSTSSDGSWWDDSLDVDYDDDEETLDGDDDGGYDALDRKARRATALRMRIEFPYDLGFFDNMAQAMGTRNFLLWLFPLACGPKIEPGGAGLGWDWPENGFNDHPGMWPPPDPEKMRHAAVRSKTTYSVYATTTITTTTAQASGYDDQQQQGSPQWGSATPEEEKAAFQVRQQADFRRRKKAAPAPGAASDDEFEQGMDGEPGWMNADGDRLRDYGVDEDAENDEDVPIALLVQRRKTKAGGEKGKKRR